MQILIFLQKLREYVDGQWNSLFLFVTELGEPTVTFLFLAFVYWCFNKRTGLLMAAGIGVTCTYSHVLKYMFKVQRPWIKNPAIHPVEQALPNAGGYSFPSGHSARAGAVWGTFGIGSFRSGKHIFFLLTGIIISFAVAFSRLFLGVHTVKDVFAGLFMSYTACIVAQYLLAWTEKGKNRDVLLSGFLFLMCFLPMIRFGCISTAGFGIGVAASWLFEKRFVQFEEPSSCTEKAERFIIGSIGIILIQYWLNGFLRSFIPAKYCGFFCQFSMAFYIIYFFPLLFTKSKKYWKQIALGFFVILLSLSFIVSCTRKTAQKLSSSAKSLYEQPLLIGHRGYFANFPQNTMASFKGAVDIGVDMIELDVQMTKDGEIVIEHDNNLSRIGQNGSIGDYTYQQLLEMDFGLYFSKDFAGTKIARLSQLLDFMKSYPEIKIYIELKDIGENEEFIKKVYGLVKESEMMSQCYFASFQKNYLEKFKQIDANCKTIYIISNYDKSTFALNYVDIYSLYEKNISQEYINIIHKQKKPVFVWTVDDLLRAMELKKMGADGFCTNQAGRIKIALHDEYIDWLCLYSGSSTLPGLYGDELPALYKDAVFQGLTRAEEYILITAYRKTNESSMLFVLDDNGKWISTFDLGFAAHTGGCGYDEIQKKLWITGAGGTVCCIEWKTLKDLIGLKEKAELIKAPAVIASFDAGLVNHNGGKVASFLDIYDGFLYAGSYTLGSNGTLRKFDITDIHNPEIVREWSIPEKTQGMTIGRENGKDYIYLSLSANTEDSKVEKYILSETESKLNRPVKTITMPEGSEQIEMNSDGTILFLFESAARPYSKTARIRNDQLWRMYGF